MTEVRWERRDRKLFRRRYGQRVSGASIKRVLLLLLVKKAAKVVKSRVRSRVRKKGYRH